MSCFAKLLINFFPVLLCSTSLLAQANSSGSIFDQSRKITSHLDNYLKRAKSLFEQIDDSKTYDNMVNGKSQDLPIPIPYNQPDPKFKLQLDSIIMTPERAYGVVFMKLDTKVFNPNADGKALYLAGTDIGFTKNGGFTGEASIFLLESVQFDMGNSVTMTILNQNPFNKDPTYASFDCDGFNELHLSGKLTFSKDIMQQEGADGKMNGQPMEVFFQTVISDWEDWIITINKIPAFQIVNLPGFSWSVQTFVLDKSITRNSPDFAPPPGYDISYLNGMPEMWNGVYFQDITVKLPKEIKEKGSKNTERTTIKGSAFLIDQKGITGEALALNVINNGEMGRWSYTVDSVGFKIIQNNITYVGFGGTLDMPLSKKVTGDGKTNLIYKVSMTLDAKKEPVYNFSVRNTDSLNFEMWKVASVKNLTTQFDIKIQSGSFGARVGLSGDLIISPYGSSSASVFDIQFQNMVIQSTKNYWVGVDKVSLSAKGKSSSFLAKLPISVNKVGIIFRNGEESLGLELQMSLNLMKSDGEDSKTSSGFGATTVFTIWAKENVETNKWSYHYIDLSSIKIEVRNPGYDLDGTLTLYRNNNIYGEGFEGRLNATFKPGIEAKVAAMFGRVSQAAPTDPIDFSDIANTYSDEKKTFRYWYVDAFVKFPSAIPIFSGVGINSFAGGAYHNMTLKGGTCSSSSLGCSINGAGSFVPDAALYLGIRAGLGIVSMPTSTVFSGNLLFGIEFLETGGINKIYFDGLAQFLTQAAMVEDTKVKEQAAKTDSDGGDIQELTGIMAKWHTEYNFSTNVFSGTFDTYMNLGYLKGAYEGYKVGRIEVYFSNSDWYFYVGRPVTPMSAVLVNIFTISSYLNTGSVLPDPPMAPMPAGFGVSSVDGAILPTGGGIAFGVRAGAKVDLNLKAGNNLCSVGGGLKAGFEIGVDVLIAKDKVPVNCNGFNPRGINNWYATGRAFAWIWGEVKVNYDCIGGKGDMTLVTLDFKAELFGQLPKPTYFEGKVNARGSVFDWINVNVNMDFKYGDICQEADNKTFELVNRVIPSDLTDTLSVYTVPSAELKMPVGSGFTYKAPDGKSNIKVIIGNPSFHVTVKGTSIVLKGNLKFDKTLTQVSFEPEKALPEDSYIEIEMTVPLIGVNEPVYKKWGFRTIKETDKIENSNIAYAYPLPQMANVYKNSGTEGYIKLRVLPSKALALPPNYTFQVRYLSGKDTVYKGAVAVTRSANVEQFKFTFPSEKLKTGTSYTFQIAKVKANTQADKRDYAQGAQSGVAGGVINQPEIVIIEYPFKTSLFNSFKDKMAVFANGDVNVDENQGIVKINLNQETVSKTKLTTEGFSRTELIGYEPEYGAEQLPPIIRLNSDPVYSKTIEDDYNSMVDPAGLFKYPLYENISISQKTAGYYINYEIPKQLKSATIQNKPTPLLGQGTYNIYCNYYLPGRPAPASQFSIEFITTKEIR